MSYHVGFIPDGDGGGFFSFLQKSNSMLNPDELAVVGLLELQAFIEANSVQLGEASLMKIFSVWSRSLLRLLKIGSLTLLEQKRAMMVGRGLSLLHLLNR